MAGERRTTVLFEAPSRVLATLSDLLAACGPLREVAVARELTKLYEEVWRGELSEAVGNVGAKEPRGEYVIVLGPAPEPPAASDEEIDAHVLAALTEGLSTRDAAAARRRATARAAPAGLRRRHPTASSHEVTEIELEPMPRPFYVTTPIYYPNDVPHIGHAYTSVAADTLARWRRMWGDDVVFLTGTDEHGTKIERAAEAQGITPQQMVDRTSERFRALSSLLDLTNTDFIRTTEPRHETAVQEFLQVVYDSGAIELGTYEGLYCVACEAYYTEDELVGGMCPVHGTPVERVTEENYFFKLSAFEQRLIDHYEAHPEAVQPATRRNEVLGFIRQGLTDFSMSRKSVTWGIPLPWDPSQTCYVWFDALFNYCSAIGYGTDPERFNRYWPVDYHLVGKDILRFHAVYWPAMLMAAGLEPPKCVFAHGWLLVGGEKMSKTRANQIAPDELVAQFGVDGFRYHFLRDQHFGPDGDISYEAMVTRYNADLANNFGNLASRVLNMAMNYCGGVVPDTREDGVLVDAAATRVRRSHRRHDDARLLEWLRRGLGPHPRRELVHRRQATVGAQQSG